MIYQVIKSNTIYLFVKWLVNDSFKLLIKTDKNLHWHTVSYGKG